MTEMQMNADANKQARDQRILLRDLSESSRQHARSVVLTKLGEVMIANGQLLEAEKSFREALALRRSLAAGEPGNVAWQRDLGVIPSAHR